MEYNVAPHWGAWIEMTATCRKPACRAVAPHWGAWIEIRVLDKIDTMNERRTPLGCVD